MQLAAARDDPACPAGLRVGALYTHNAKLISAYEGIAHMSGVSHLTQCQLIELFDDTAFIDAFIAQNRANLEANCEIVTDGLTAMDVPFTQPEARCLSLSLPLLFRARVSAGSNQRGIRTLGTRTVLSALGERPWPACADRRSRKRG